MASHNLGSFLTLSRVWKLYPSGGVSGDYVTISDIIYTWDDTDDSWTSTGLPDGGTSGGEPSEGGTKTFDRLNAKEVHTDYVYVKHPPYPEKDHRHSYKDIDFEGEITSSETIFFTTYYDSIPASIDPSFIATNSIEEYSGKTFQDNGFTPYNWAIFQTSVSDVNRFAWSCKRVKSNDKWGLFSEPSLVAIYSKGGIKGNDGKDGNGIEFIYKSSTTAVMDSALYPSNNSTELDVNGKSFNESEYLPFGWSDETFDVNEASPFLFISKRVYNGVTKNWSGFSEPKTLSVFMKGKDGSDIEFVFLLTSDDIKPETPVIGSENEEIPSGGWTDDPQSTTKALPYQWVSRRVKSNGLWGAFSTPASWSNKSNSIIGVIEYYVCNNSTTAPTEGWTTTVPEVSLSNPYLWNKEVMSFTLNDDSETEPHIILIFNEDGKDGISISNIQSKYVLSKTITTPSITNALWSDNPLVMTSVYKYLYNYDLITYTDDSTSSTTIRLIGIYGDVGPAGADGKGYEFVFKHQISAYPPSRPVGTDVDNSKPSGWELDPVGVSELYPYEFSSKRIKVAGHWQSFSDPKLFCRYAKDGAVGADGKGYELIFKLSGTTSSVIPDSEDTDDFVPSGGWTDDPQGATEELIYELVSKRVKVNGVWGAFSTPSVWSKFAFNGNDGASIIWKGSFSIPPTNPINGWAYYNTVLGKSYIYQSGSWNIMTSNGVGVIWKGIYTVAPANPELNWIYKNSTTGTTYIFDGEKWNVFTMDGAKGSIGRVPYPAGEFSTQKAYVCTEMSSPYVLSAGDYYYMSKVGTWPSGNPPPEDDYSDFGSEAVWQIFDNYKALYVELLIADMGKIANSVFSGDYMFSTWGHNVGSDTQTNEYSKPEQSGGSFIPNMIMNFLKGTAEFCKGAVKFLEDSVSLAHGMFVFTDTALIQKVPTRISWIKIKDLITPSIYAAKLLNLDFHNGMYFITNCGYDTESVIVKIPKASDYKEAVFFLKDEGPYTRSLGNMSFRFEDGGCEILRVGIDSNAGLIVSEDVINYSMPINTLCEAVSTPNYDGSEWSWKINEKKITT